MTPSCARTLCLALLLLPLPLAAQAADVNDQSGSNSVSIKPRPSPTAPPMRRGPDPIQKPANPDKVRGTYELAGEKRSLTEGAFYDTYLVLKPHEDKPQRPLQEQQVLEHILLFAEAQGMGFELSADEKDLINPLKTQAIFKDAIEQRMKGWGITEDQYIRYLAEKQAIQRLKNWYANSVRVRSSEVYEMWKRDNFLFRVSYVEFNADEYESELRKKAPTDEELQNFYKTNPQIQNRMRIPTSVTADIVIFDPSSVSEEEIARLQGTRKIKRDEALVYFNNNKERLVRQIPSEDRPKLYPPPGEAPPPVDKLVTPFALLREQIDRELILGNRIQAAFDESEGAKSPDDIKNAAEKHGLTHLRLERTSRQTALTEHVELGASLFTDLFNAQAGNLSPGVQFNGKVQFFWRLQDKAVSSLPPFDQVKDQLADPWYAQTAYMKAQEAGTEFLNKMQDAVKQVTDEQEKKIDLEAAAKAKAEIERQELTNEQRKQLEQQKWRAWAENEKRKIRSDLMPQHFEAVVSESGRALKQHGPFAFTFRTDRKTITDIEQQRIAFIESNFQIKSLGPGHVSPILSDIVTQSHFIVRVDSKEEPPFDDMTAVDYYQRRMAAERQNTFTTNYMWTGFQAQRRLKWAQNR